MKLIVSTPAPGDNKIIVENLTGVLRLEVPLPFDPERRAAIRAELADLLNGRNRA